MFRTTLAATLVAATVAAALAPSASASTAQTSTEFRLESSYTVFHGTDYPMVARFTAPAQVDRVEAIAHYQDGPTDGVVVGSSPVTADGMYRFMVPVPRMANEQEFRLGIRAYRADGIEEYAGTVLLAVVDMRSVSSDARVILSSRQNLFTSVEPHVDDTRTVTSLTGVLDGNDVGQATCAPREPIPPTTYGKPDGTTYTVNSSYDVVECEWPDHFLRPGTHRLAAQALLSDGTTQVLAERTYVIQMSTYSDVGLQPQSYDPNAPAVKLLGNVSGGPVGYPVPHAGDIAVKLQQRGADGTWAEFRTGITDAKGDAFFQVPWPKQRAVYRLVVPSTPFILPSVSRAFAVVPPSVDLSLSPVVISAGDPTTVTYRGTPGSTIDILARTQPATAFSKIGTVTLDSDGVGTSTHRPQKNTRITARTASGVMSDNAPIIAVRSVASFNANRVGTRTYTFTGRVYPALNNRLVNIYRNGSLVAQARSDATGIYKVTRTLGAGTFTFGARTPNDQSNLGATSPTRSVRIY